LAKGISHKQKIALDRWFALPFRIVRGLFSGNNDSLSQQKQHVFIVKLFGMGSIVRVKYELDMRGVDCNAVTLVTHSENAIIAKRLGFQTIIIGGDSLLKMAWSAWKCKQKLSNEKVALTLDLERSSNLIGMFSHVLAANRPLVGFGNKLWNGTARNYLSPETSAMQDLVALVFGEIANKEFQTKVYPKRKHQILINVNASEYLSERRFPKNKFLDLIQKLKLQFRHCTFILTGSKNEYECVESVFSDLKARGVEVENSAGKWSLDQLCDEIASSQLLVTNDSGPLHLSNLYNTPTVAIWGPTSPDRIGYPDSDLMLNLSLKMPCQPCFVHPKSEVAKACGGAISCLKEMDVEFMSAQILPFAKRFILPSNTSTEV
jgi:ADP-heptose:LPS heptosyltransferase